MADAAHLRERLADCYVSACRAEVEALKPGNVHVFADGHGMVVQQFLTSAEVSAGPLTHPGWPVGRRILEAIRATRRAAGLNTNLGIVLLCGPLLAAAERCVFQGRPVDTHSGPLRGPPLPRSTGERKSAKSGYAEEVGADVSAASSPPSSGGEVVRAADRSGGRIEGTGLRRQVASILQSLDMADARDVFAAIAHADPGGLGEADDDVRAPPRIGLLDAMRQAADRDTIARQYADGFAAVFDVGLAELDAARSRGEAGMWPCVAAYLRFVSTFPDSHVARKFGMEAAGKLRERAATLRDDLAATQGEERRLALLRAADHELKARGINPGTSADLTVASLLVRDLRDNLHIQIDDA